MVVRVATAVMMLVPTIRSRRQGVKTLVVETEIEEAGKAYLLEKLNWVLWMLEERLQGWGHQSSLPLQGVVLLEEWHSFLFEAFKSKEIGASRPGLIGTAFGFAGLTVQPLVEFPFHLFSLLVCLCKQLHFPLGF